MMSNTNRQNDLWQKLLHRPQNANKYDFGHVLVIGGSDGMEGAPLLVAQAAMRTGAGLVTIVTTPTAAERIAGNVEEVMVQGVIESDTEQTLRAMSDFIADRSVNTVVIGPGMSAESQEFIRGFLSQTKLPVVVDATALRALSGQEETMSTITAYNPELVFTPHSGEFASLIAQEHANETDATAFVTRYDTTLVLKGNPTYVASRSALLKVDTGGPALATAGTGDVLAGVIAAIIAQGVPLPTAAHMAVQLHGQAGTIAAQQKTEPGVIATDVIEALPIALQMMQE